MLMMMIMMRHGGNLHSGIIELHGIQVEKLGGSRGVFHGEYWWVFEAAKLSKIKATIRRFMGIKNALVGVQGIATCKTNQ